MDGCVVPGQVMIMSTSVSSIYSGHEWTVGHFMIIVTASWIAGHVRRQETVINILAYVDFMVSL